MFVDVEKMLPDEILKMISLLTDELSKKEKSKGIIDLEIHKEKVIHRENYNDSSYYNEFYATTVPIIELDIFIVTVSIGASSPPP